MSNDLMREQSDDKKKVADYEILRDVIGRSQCHAAPCFNAATPLVKRLEMGGHLIGFLFAALPTQHLFDELGNRRIAYCFQ